MYRTIVSTGGVGSCAVEDFLRQYIDTTNAHRRNPELGIPGKVLYIFGDPRNQTLSFFRRGFMMEPYDHCQHVEGNVKGLRDRRAWFMDNYFENGVDYYGLGAHLFGWYSFKQRKYDILFARYETLGDHIKDIVDFMEVPLNPEDFIFKPRESDWQSLPGSMQEHLTNMFRDYIGWKLPDIEIKKGHHETDTD